MEIKFEEKYNSINIIEEFITNSDELVIYGNEALSKKLIMFIKDKYHKGNFTFVLFDENKQENFLLSDKIIIASYHETIIANKLYEEYGFCYGKNFIFFNHILEYDNLPKNSIGIKFVDLFNKKRNLFLDTFNILEDKYSKNIFYKILRLRANSLNIERIKPSELPTTYEEQIMYENNVNNYLEYLSIIDNEILKKHIAFTISLDSYSYFDKVTPKNKKAIINAGAYNTTSVMFAFHSPEANIYAFEPQKDIHNDNLYLSNKYTNIIPINKGIWEKTTSLSFNIPIGESTASSIKEDGLDIIDVVAIDDFCQNNNINNIDFIKMDIEGAEIEALLGASQTIKTQKPDLAISIYHKPEHLYEIPLLIKELLPEYKIFIDHKYYSYTETVCFATISV